MSITMSRSIKLNPFSINVSEFLSYSGAVTLRWFFGSFLSIYIGSVVLKLRTFTSESF